MKSNKSLRRVMAMLPLFPGVGVLLGLLLGAVVGILLTVGAGVWNTVGVGI